MDMLLIAVAAISLAMAIGMAVVVARLLRDERARAEARVAALSTMAAEPTPAADVARAPRISRPAPPAVPSDEAPRPAAPAFTSAGRTSRVPATTGSAAMRGAPQFDDLEIRPAAQAPVHTGDLFAERNQLSAWGPRLAVIGTLVVALAAIGFIMKSATAPSASVAGTATVPNPSPAENAPLELLSLGHAQQAQTLTITGMVRNPRTGAPLSRMVATAIVFAADGSFLASSRAPLDYPMIAPGDESPFVVTVPVSGDVSRYRVGFRTDDGRVVAHVDKRTPEALASTSPK